MKDSSDREMSESSLQSKIWYWSVRAGGALILAFVGGGTVGVVNQATFQSFVTKQAERDAKQDTEIDATWVKADHGQRALEYRIYERIDKVDGKIDRLLQGNSRIEGRFEQMDRERRTP